MESGFLQLCTSTFNSSSTSIMNLQSKLSSLDSCNPILLLAEQAGFKISTFPVKAIDWELALTMFGKIHMLASSIALFLFIVSKLPPSLLRSAGGALGLLAMITMPWILGKTHMPAVDFAVPGYVFIGTLQGYVLIFSRSPAEIQSWSFARFFCSFLCYVQDPPLNPKHPRLENLKGLKLCALKIALVNLCLYFIPPPHLLSEIRNWVPFVLYNTTGVITNLYVIGGYIEGISRIMGLIFGIEMGYLMKDPWAAKNLSDFWRRWNQPITTSFHRIAYGKKVRRAVELKSMPEASELHGKSVQRPPKSSLDSVNGLTSSTSNISEIESERSEQRHLKPTEKPYTIKTAMKVWMIFTLSGVFHEYMNLHTFSSPPTIAPSFSALLFFLIHGTLINTHLLLVHVFPRQMSLIPNPLAWLFNFSVECLICFLFMTPMLEGGIFEDFRNFGLLGKVNGFIWIFGQ